MLECGIALLILAASGLTQRHLPARYDDRSVAVISIVDATVARTALHVPLWGLGAITRLGLSLVLAWLLWRIWPLIVGHVLWDTPAVLLSTTDCHGRRHRGSLRDPARNMIPC